MMRRPHAACWMFQISEDSTLGVQEGGLGAPRTRPGVAELGSQRRSPTLLGDGVAAPPRSRGGGGGLSDEQDLDSCATAAVGLGKRALGEVDDARHHIRLREGHGDRPAL